MDDAPDPRDTLAPVPASTLRLPVGAWETVFECLCDHFPRIAPHEWRSRFERGRVLDAAGEPLDLAQAYRAGLCVQYFREVADEVPVPFAERIVQADAELVVADKPHFLAVAPSGRHVADTLLGRLVRHFGNAHLVPLHRIDRGTAGLVMFSANPATRARYQALFRERAIVKRYEAIAAALPGLAFPLVRRSRIVAGEPFFRMREIEGPANSETRIEPIDREQVHWRYALTPVTGRKHQLRVHMAALGAPILDDPFYPQARAEAADDYTRPLHLLARALDFRDPIDGRRRHFESARTL